MLKIATHNSATGEEGKDFLSWLITPFSKCQSKTIKEQYEAGCRMFDIRFKEVNNTFYCKHGLWTSKRALINILSEINSFKDSCYVSVTYEGKNEEYDLNMVFTEWRNLFKNIKFQYMAVKYGKSSNGVKVSYDFIARDYNIECKQGFLPLNGKSWHTYLPIPWLWKKLYYNKPKFNKETYLTVDFL